MNFKSTPVKCLLICLITVKMLTGPSAQAQYCSPTFGYGCFSWSNQAVQLDSIDWVLDSYFCDLSDYTSLSTTVTAGSTHPMHVTNANWCGCGVWMDMNQDFSFDSSENLFHLYSANETNSYDFAITIPANISAGTYRLRVIAGWGTDCFAESANGFGGCGSYQYGNFDDFTVHVADIATGSPTISGNGFSFIDVSPNPAANMISVTIKNFASHNAILQLCDVGGRVLQSHFVTNEKEMLDVSTLSAGVYFLKYRDGLHEQTIKLIR